MVVSESMPQMAPVVEVVCRGVHSFVGIKALHKQQGTCDIITHVFIITHIWCRGVFRPIAQW